MVVVNRLPADYFEETAWERLAAKFGVSGSKLTAGVTGVASALAGAGECARRAPLAPDTRTRPHTSVFAHIHLKRLPAAAPANPGINYLASDGSCTVFDGTCGGCRSFYALLYSHNQDQTRQGPMLQLESSSCTGGSMCSPW